MSAKSYLLIGLIIGGVLGTGASYFVVFPGMVDTKIGEFTQRITTIESSINTLTSEVSTLKSQYTSLQGLTDAIDSLSSSIIQLNSDLSTVESTLDAIQNEIEQTRILAEKSVAYEILKKEAAKPGEFIVGLLIDELFDELRESENKIITWIALVGQNVAKDAIATIVNSQIPALVWNNYDASQAGSDLYDIYIVTYFPIEIDTGLPIVGTINVARINLVLKGRVNVSSGTVSSIEVWNIMLS